MKMAKRITAGLTSAALALTLGLMPAATAIAAEYGDANLDGKVSIVDVIMINKSVLGAETLSAEQRTVSDVDGNGDVTAEDSLMILKFLVDLVDDLTPDTTVPTEPTTTAAPETTTAPATTAATETDPVEPETTEAPVTTTTAAETTTAEVPETTEAPETTTTAEMTTTEAPVTTTEAPVTTTEAPVTTTEAPVTTTEAPVTTTEAPVTTTEAPVTTTEAPVTTTEAPETTTEAPETTTEAPETTTEAPVTTTEAPATTTEGIVSEYAEVRETGTDANGNAILDVSNGTKVEIVVTGGEANAGANGCFGYMGEEWTNLKWEMVLDEDGTGVAYVEVPEGQTSLQFQLWYYSGASSDDLTFTFTVERDPATILVGETEVRELVDGTLNVSGASKVEIHITGGIAGANINGGYGYTDPETGWTDPMPTWAGSFNAEGELTVYLTVPEGVTSFQIHTWYYGLGDETYDTAALTTVYTVQLVETAE
ncbi:MAG: dockerin type I repeat-containing protein [Oscillospiraceae bacterium]|nr:dockerin type I repeat-containing protein [Oscillospiraceae bacterium]